MVLAIWGKRGTSDTDNINKDTFSSDTYYNNKDLNDGETRTQKRRRRKRGAPKKKADSKFVWDKTPKDPELFELPTNSARPFGFLKQFLTEELFLTMVYKIKEYTEKVIATSRP